MYNPEERLPHITSDMLTSLFGKISKKMIMDNELKKKQNSVNVHSVASCE